MAKTGKRKSLKIIDAHNHPDWHGHNLERVIENMDKYGIAKTWLLTWEAPHNEVDPCYSASCHSYIFNEYDNGPISFQRCLSYIERAPERFILGYCPDPRHPDAIHKLQCAIDLYGVKVCGELKVRMMYDNPDAVRMFRFCGEKGLPVVIHLDDAVDTERFYPRPDYWYGGGIDALERAIQKCPDTIFLGHAPGFWSHISDDKKAGRQSYPDGKVEGEGKLVKMLKKYPNLYCDISAGSGRKALSRDLDFSKYFLTEFQDRILYSRDYFDNEHQELLNGLKLPKAVCDKIYFKNAEKLIPVK